MNFGGSSWGSSTGFGANANSSGPTATSAPLGGGLFGNSSTQNNNPNNTSSTQPGQQGLGSSLFGNSQEGSNKRASTGLFGSSTSNQPSGGLFGNSSTSSQAPGGGLFGNSANKTGGGLFGNSSTLTNTAAPSAPGLFNKPATGGAPSGGLFGNSSSINSSSGGLFGGSSNTAGSGGLFGNSAQKPATGGLFGGSNTSGGGMFSNPATSGGLFGNSSSTQQQQQQPQQASINSADPYNSGQILSTIQNSTNTMPASLTGSLFANSSIRLPSITEPSKQPQRKSSLLGRLAQTFNIFRYNTDMSSSNSGVGKLKGLFTQLNYIREGPHQNRLNLGVKKPQKRFSRLPIENKSVGEVKRLVIQSRPSKFHQINADKVFSAKKRRVLVLSLDNHLIGNDYEEFDVDNENVQLKDESFRKEKTPQQKEEPKQEEQTDTNGYWCSPSIEALEQMSPEQLSSVDGFIVGRKSKGQIAYVFPVDLTTIFDRCRQNDVPFSSVLFDDIIKIEDGFVKVYFDYEAAKPPISRELNVPAIITLKSEPKKRSLDEHIKRLKNVVGAEFVTYDPIEYYWTFKVKHFSVWGLIDDSEDEADETEDRKRIRAVKKKQDEQEEESSRLYSRIYEDPAYQQELKRQKVIRQSEGVPGAWDYGSIAKHDTSLAMKQQAVEDEITRQVKSYKEDKSANALAANVSDITVQSSSEEDEEDDILVDVPAAYGDDNKFDYLKQIVSVLPPYTDMRSLVDEKAYEPVLDSENAFLNLNKPTNLPTSEDWLVQLEMSNDLNSALTPYIAVPRKSGLALRNVNDILFSDFNKSSVGIDQVSTPIKDKAPLAVFEKEPKLNSRIVTSIVQTLLLNSPVSSRSNNLPLIKVPASITFAELAAIDQDNSEVLKLASILFDPFHVKNSPKYKDVDETDNKLVNRLQQIEQRTALSGWLQRHNKDKLQLSGDTLHNVFIKVVNGQLKEAIELAISSRNVHLSVLLTLLDSNDKAAKEIARSQLEDWPTEDNLVPAPILNIYHILSGDFSALDSIVSPIVKFAVLVNYGSSTTTVQELLDNVDFANDDSEVASLLEFYKEYQKNGKEAASRQLQGSETKVSLKWTLSQLLDLDRTSNDFFCEKFGSGLEAYGLWKEALFIYAMITNDTKALEKLRHVVMSNVTHIKGDTVDEEDYLANVLKIPRSLIYEAVAEEKNREKDFWAKGDALVTAELWDRVHENIVAELGPTTVIQGDYSAWSRLIAMIDRFPDNGRIIPSWNQGGGLFSTYFETLQAFEKFEEVSPEKITFLLENLAQFDTEGRFKSRAAVNIMLKTVGDAALDRKEPFNALKEKLQAIDMGENEKVYFDSRFAATQ